jgi:hypothetical protein
MLIWNKPIRRRRHVMWIMLVAVSVSCFVAWRDEYTSAEWRGNRIANLESQLEQTRANKSPNFVGAIDGVAGGSFHKQPLVVVDMWLGNAGAPSGASNFRMRVELDDSRIIQGVVPLILDKDLKMPRHRGTTVEVVLRRNDFLPSKAAQAICLGCSFESWCWAIYPAIAKPDDLYAHKAVIVIEFTDIATGELHVV